MTVHGDRFTPFRSLSRVFVAPDQISGDTVRHHGIAAHHLLHVLRMRQGDTFGVLDGSGRAWVARIGSCRRSEATATLLEAVSDPSPPVRHVEIALPLLKSDRMAFALQKCTEIGVSHFHIVPAERAVARVVGNDETKTSRFLTIVTQAAEQCGAFILPKITMWVKLDSFFSQISVPERYIAWEQERLASATALLAGSDPCLLAAGPEGGLSEAEVRLWLDNGFRSVTLGPRTLRAETAPMVMAALAMCGAPER